MGNCISPGIKGLSHSYPCAAKDSKVVFGNIARKMALVSGTSFSQLETRLSQAFSLHIPFVITYQDEDGHTVMVENTEDLGFFIGDGRGPRQLDIELNEKSLGITSVHDNSFIQRTERNSLISIPEPRIERNSLISIPELRNPISRPLPAHTKHSSNEIEESSTGVNIPGSSPCSLKGRLSRTFQNPTPSLDLKLERLQQLRQDCLDMFQETFALEDIHDIIMDQIRHRVEIDLTVYEDSLRRLTKPSACPSLALPSINLEYSSSTSNHLDGFESLERHPSGSFHS